MRRVDMSSRTGGVPATRSSKPLVLTMVLNVCVEDVRLKVRASRMLVRLFGAHLHAERASPPIERRARDPSGPLADGPQTVRDVHAEIAKQRDVGYTTVLKTMQVMAEKGPRAPR